MKNGLRSCRSDSVGLCPGLLMIPAPPPTTRAQYFVLDLEHIAGGETQALAISVVQYSKSEYWTTLMAWSPLGHYFVLDQNKGVLSTK